VHNSSSSSFEKNISYSKVSISLPSGTYFTFNETRLSHFSASKNASQRNTGIS